MVYIRNSKGEITATYNDLDAMYEEMKQKIYDLEAKKQRAFGVGFLVGCLSSSIIIAAAIIIKYF